MVVSLSDTSAMRFWRKIRCVVRLIVRCMASWDIFGQLGTHVAPKKSTTTNSHDRNCGVSPGFAILMDYDYSCAGGAGPCHEEDGRADGPCERDVPQDRQVPGDALLWCPSPRISVFRALLIRALRLYVSSKLPKIKKVSLFLGYFLKCRFIDQCDVNSWSRRRCATVYPP